VLRRSFKPTLTAVIGVVNHPLWLTLLQDHGQVEETSPGGHKGDIGHPLIGGGGSEVPSHQIRRRGRIHRPARRLDAGAPTDPLEALLARQSGHLFNAETGLLTTQLFQDTRHPIGTARLRINRLDALPHPLVSPGPRRGLAPTPGVIAAGGDPQSPHISLTGYTA